MFYEVNLTASLRSYDSTTDSLEGISSFGLGYRGMCRYAIIVLRSPESMHLYIVFARDRFFCNETSRMMSGPVFLLPPLKGIDRFFIRLDADSHVTRPVTKRTDPLEAASQGGHAYVFWSVALESCR